MDTLKVMVTACGSPGVMGTYYSLKNNWDNRKIVCVGTDIREDVSGKLFLEKFYTVPEPENEMEFVSTIINIAREENIDVILPGATRELWTYSKYKKKIEKETDAKVAVSPFTSIQLSNDKYKLFKVAEKIGIPTPRYRLAKTPEEIAECATELGYPDKKIVVKPTVSNGSRGLRILNNKVDKFNILLTQKPTVAETTLEEFMSIIDSHDIPPYLVMEYLPGTEYTVDVLGSKNEVHVVVPRSRKKITLGISFHGVIERREDLIEFSEKLAKALKLEYAFGFQFIEDRDGVPRLIECNPRIQGTMAASTLAGANIIYGAVKLALNEEIPEFHVLWGMEFHRYWGLISPEGKI